MFVDHDDPALWSMLVGSLFHNDREHTNGGRGHNRKALHANVKWTISPITWRSAVFIWIADRARELGKPAPKWREFSANFPRHKEANLAWPNRDL
jgi:hypothetical protein